MSNKHSVISLFSGAGGIDIGFQMAGNFDILLANDILYAPALTYTRNFGCTLVDVENQNSNDNCPVYLLGDVSKIDFSNLEADVVIGGPPVSGFLGNQRCGKARNRS